MKHSYKVTGTSCIGCKNNEMLTKCIEHVILWDATTPYTNRYDDI